VLLGLASVPVAVILGWRALAPSIDIDLFEAFDTLVVLASLGVVATGLHLLRRRHVVLAVVAGLGLGLLVPFTGFYPLLGWLVPPGIERAWSALGHGAGVSVALLAGIVIARRGGPVRLRLAGGDVRSAVQGLGFGALVGLPLAALNAVANVVVQGRPFAWQASAFPFVEALEPGLVEEIVYRFALLGLVWLALRPYWGRHAPWLAGAFALLVHTFAHNGELLLTQPLVYLGFGAVLAVVWGVPLTVLALRRDLESAAGFHWVQDAVRFMGGL
jgi:hypothetical protein